MDSWNGSRLAVELYWNINNDVSCGIMIQFLFRLKELVLGINIQYLASTLGRLAVHGWWLNVTCLNGMVTVLNIKQVKLELERLGLG